MKKINFLALFCWICLGIFALAPAASANVAFAPFSRSGDWILFIGFLLLTEIIELPAAYIFGLKKKQELLVLFFINIITNPLVNFLIILNGYYGFFQNDFWSIFIIEAINVLVEYQLLQYFLKRKSRSLLYISLGINLISLILGMFILEWVQNFFWYWF